MNSFYLKLIITLTLIFIYSNSFSENLTYKDFSLGDQKNKILQIIKSNYKNFKIKKDKKKNELIFQSINRPTPKIYFSFTKKDILYNIYIIHEIKTINVQYFIEHMKKKYINYEYKEIFYKLNPLTAEIYYKAEIKNNVDLIIEIEIRHSIDGDYDVLAIEYCNNKLKNEVLKEIYINKLKLKKNIEEYENF